MTKIELKKVSHRIDEIQATLDDLNCPEDVYNNLCDELEYIIMTLENDLKPKLKLIKGEK